MKHQRILNFLSRRLDSSTKLLGLIAVTVLLTSFAIVLSSNFVHERRLNDLQSSAKNYTAQINAKIKDEEEKIRSVASLENTDDLSKFNQRVQRLMNEQPNLVRIELRNEAGKLLAQRDAKPSKELLATNNRQQLTPSVLQSFLRASEQQKVFWAYSYTTSGQATPEMVVPTRAKNLMWIAQVDPSYWLTPKSGIDLKPNMRVQISEQAPPILGRSLSAADALDLPGLKSQLVFGYANATDLALDSTSWLLAVLGVLLCFLLVRYALDLKRNRLAQETIARQEIVLARQSQLSTMGEVSTALAHELNQPLATIANYVAVCEMRVKSQGYVDPVLSEALLNARKQAIRAGEVVQSIRSYLKWRPNVMTSVDVKNMLHDLEPILLLSAKDLQANITIQSEKNLCTLIDQALLEQVVINLSRNGLEAMLNVDVKNRLLNIHAYTHSSRNGSHWLRIDVRDAGHGISEQDAQSLFQTFFTTKADGMGIGLNLCRSVAESYGGRIRWANNTHTGATFSLYLPKLMNA